MKPIPAIVENGEARAARRVDDAFRTFAAAAANMRERRLELGRALVEARALFPATGRNAGGWSRFIAERKINMDVALDAMKYAGYVEGHCRPGDPLPTRKEAGIDPPRSGPERVGSAGAFPPANVNGGSGEPARGTYCTPAKYAAAVGPWDLDPFSNPRSHIVSTESCQLERGDNGLLDPELAGSYLLAGADRPTGPFDLESDDAIVAAARRGQRRATASTRVWIQPPYSIVEAVIAHYGHTRFCALLRFDPSTDWFATLWKLTRVVAIPFGERLEFEGPPEIKTSENPYPHAFYYADERDVTPAIRELCIVLRVEH